MRRTIRSLAAAPLCALLCLAWPAALLADSLPSPLPAPTTSFAPTASCNNAGTITTSSTSSKYVLSGKMLFYDFTLNVSANSCNFNVLVPLPLSLLAAGGDFLFGKDGSVAGGSNNMMLCQASAGSNTLFCSTATGGVPSGVGNALQASGWVAVQ